MFFLTASLVVFALLESAARANNCSNEGIFVDIHERLVDGREDFFQLGLFIGLGTPSQNNSLWPTITHNETVFAAPDYCSLDTSSSCPTNFHGFISVESSSSWKDTPEYEALDDVSTVANTIARRGLDTLNIWTHYFDPSPATGTYLHNFPATVLSNYTATVDPFFGPAGTFGLGSSSTVLNRLYNDNLIGARSYGLYVGSRPDRAGGTQNGSIVLGGYDSGRFTGPLLSYDQVPALEQNGFSPFKVSISQISLVTKQGQNVAFVTDGAFDAYLTTSQFPVQFPTTITQRLATALKGTPANNDDNTLRTQSGFDGNLMITLSNNLTFTFDSSWISNASSISPISAAPLQTITNNATTTASQASSLPILLGAAFLEQVYMFVQYDSTPPSFSLAQAELYGQYVQPQPFCPGIVPAEALPPHINSFAKKGLTGAILGGLIGGGAISALVWILFGPRLRSCFTRKSQSTRPETFAYRDTKTDQKPTTKIPNSIAAGIEIEKSTSRSSSSSSPLPNSRNSNPQKSQDQNIEMSPLSKSGLTIPTSLPSNSSSSEPDNIISQQATYPLPSSHADRFNFNDTPLATPIPPTPNSAVPLLNNLQPQPQSRWPDISQPRNQSRSRRPTLTVQTTGPSEGEPAPIPTFAPPPVAQQKLKSTSRLRTIMLKSGR